MGGGRRPATVGHAARRQAPLAYPTNLSRDALPLCASTATRLERLTPGRWGAPGQDRSWADWTAALARTMLLGHHGPSSAQDARDDRGAARALYPDGPKALPPELIDGLE